MKRSLIPLGYCAIVIAIATLVALAGAQHGITLGGFPVLILCALLAFAVQWVVFVPSYIFQTEHYFDLTGSATYITIAGAALWLGTSTVTPGLDPRSLLIATLILFWAARLGSFLFRRIKQLGRDPRFDKIKVFWPRFLLTWTIQGLWVFLTLAAALTAMTTAAPKPLGVLAALGALVWIAGFSIEVVADAQKSRFNNNPGNAGKHVDVGLWRWSRHPNYFGEIVLWLGVTVIAAPVLQGWQWVTLISPIFVFVLLTRISGIPLLEKRADEKFGDNPEYLRYKENTSELVPLPPRQ